jgi:tRNA (guanine-N7-)-methyltransferase
MAKNKLFRFAEVARMPHVLEAPEIEAGNSSNPKGNWRSSIFKRTGPLCLELACGKGEYSLFLSQHQPEGNYVGLDIKGARIYIGAKQVEDNNLQNVAFLRTYIDHITNYFAEDEVDEIWIIFPDPYLGRSKARKRLTSPLFLHRYQHILKKGGTVNLKTDSETLWQYTLTVVEQLGLQVQRRVDDVYNEAKDDPVLTNKTFYEQGHLQKGRTIHFISFTLPSQAIDPATSILFEEEGYTC